MNRKKAACRRLMDGRLLFAFLVGTANRLCANLRRLLWPGINYSFKNISRRFAPIARNCKIARNDRVARNGRVENDSQ